MGRRSVRGGGKTADSKSAATPALVAIPTTTATLTTPVAVAITYIAARNAGAAAPAIQGVPPTGGGTPRGVFRVIAQNSGKKVSPRLTPFSTVTATFTTRWSS